MVALMRLFINLQVALTFQFPFIPTFLDSFMILIPVYLNNLIKSLALIVIHSPIHQSLIVIHLLLLCPSMVALMRLFINLQLTFKFQFAFLPVS